VFNCVFGVERLTRHGAPQELQPHTKRAIPALRDDSDVASQHRLCELVHHRRVIVTVSKKQLERRKSGRSVGQGKGWEICRVLKEETSFQVNSPSQRIHHEWWSILCCHC